jgi:transcription initiation factor TFIID subunit 2
MDSEGNLRSLRLLAFDALLLCRPLGRSQPLARYLLEVVSKDTSLVVRRYVARAMSESILMALALGDIYNAAAKIIDTSSDERARRKETEKAIVIALRSDYDKRPEVMSWVGKLFK